GPVTRERHDHFPGPRFGGPPVVRKTDSALENGDPGGAGVRPDGELGPDVLYFAEGCPHYEWPGALVSDLETGSAVEQDIPDFSPQLRHDRALGAKLYPSPIVQRHGHGLPWPSPPLPAAEWSRGLPGGLVRLHEY